jgi:hypothetical protein
VIYLDSSVALAHLLAENRRPPASLWDQPLVSSRLLEFEVWRRIHARSLAATQGADVHALLARVSFIEMTRTALARAVDPFPVRLRALDAMHLATIVYLQGQRDTIQLASYDDRMLTAASAMGIALYS